MIKWRLLQAMRTDQFDKTGVQFGAPISPYGSVEYMEHK
ncbi:unnamed protein product [Ceutorhynchus assimilis]|uniref:Uncharacterized protein n=1 Tax=Ceutorhynchus assimilis TaxID=467358 RepID=A0A9N9MTM4_9CUCU|nr:unnamed protein product [Ceutorhynchus assimilis]